LTDFWFSWIIYHSTIPSDASIAGSLAQRLSELPQLIDLNVNGHSATFFPDLGAFTGLQRLRIAGIGGEYDGLDTLIANNPGLLHLDIEARIPIDGNGGTLLHFPDIFALISSPQVIRLRSLGLSWFAIRGGSDITPHLQSLESLRLRGVLQWGTTPESSPMVYGIWNPLGKSGASLRHIEVDRVDHGLLDYLTSSSGLETLRITSVSESTDRNLAYRLFTSVLPRHANSLRSLFVCVPPDNAYCFHSDYCKSLLVCEALVDLSLSIGASSEKLQLGIVSLKIAIIY
jgi:hypothetical protein